MLLPGGPLRPHADLDLFDRLRAGQPAWAPFYTLHKIMAGLLDTYTLSGQRQALDIPPATLFAFQILLGVVFGIWGLALALPLMAIVKVMIDHFKAEGASPATAP